MSNYSAKRLDATPPNKSGPTSDIQAEDYAFLVKRIAHHIMARMPSSVQVEDLIQSGMIGLLEALQKYDATKGASFETYAGIRIRGAIVDEMRRGDWVPRSVHKNNRLINQAIGEIEARSGRDAKDTEVADYLGVDIDEYYSMARDCASSRLFSLDESLEDDEFKSGTQIKDSVNPGPDQAVTGSAMKRALTSEIERLPDREKLVLSLYYTEELNLKEIGEVLGVSESRVSQIHSQATSRLRARLRDWRA
jgi:RNA polymerase sigma factor for flagellar operon FliA